MPLIAFGKYLRSLRERPELGIRSQREVVAQLETVGIDISQSLVNKYENGDVRDPDPAVLQGLAHVYKTDYMELVLRLVREKYAVTADAAGSANRRLYDGRLKVCEQTLKRFSKIGGIEIGKDVLELEILQLEAKARLIGDEELLDVKGLARWERDFPDLKKFWVAAVQYVDNDDPDVEEAVIANLRRGVIYTYFIPHTEVGPYKSFWNLRGLLVQRVGKELVEKQLVAVPLNPERIRTLSVDYAIANPLVQQASSTFGFQCIRRAVDNRPEFAFPIPARALAGVVELLAGYLEEYGNSDEAKRTTDGIAPAKVVERTLKLVA